MTPLIDCDVLLYEIGYCGEYIDEDTGEKVPRNFDVVAEAFDQKVYEICGEVWATEEPILFVTNNKRIYKRREKSKAKAAKAIKKAMEKGEDTELTLEALEPAPYVPNFRDTVAKKKPYKGNRKDNRPYHWENLLVYVMANYDVRLAEGMEADDLICIHQMLAEPLTTIICTRDKDLRICPGMHFGWSCGRQAQFGPCQVDKLGVLEINNGKISGTGLKFFYSQILTGDNTDNIPGLPRCGPVKAFKLLEQCDDEAALFEAVKEAYRSSYGDNDWHSEMDEQAQLLWMIQEVDDYGKPVYYKMYDER